MRNIALIILSFVISQQSSHAKEVAGEIVSVNGIAFIRPDKSDAPMPKSPPRAKSGDNVYVGDVINTSSDANVKILMRDKSIVDLGSSSLFKVDEYVHNHGDDRKAKLELTFGKVRVAVTRKIDGDGKFQVKTRGATMGVRGTEFVVKESVPDRLSKSDKSAPSDSPKQQKTEITVVQGKVDVTAAPVPAAKVDGKNAAAPAPVKTVSLTAGTQITTGVGAPPMSAPVKLSETQLTALKVETKISDNTFAKAITIEPMSSSESGPNRSPSSEGSGGASGGPAAAGPVIAMVPKDLPQISVKDMPPPDVMGRPPIGNPFTTVNSTMKRLHVTIVTAATTAAMP